MTAPASRRLYRDNRRRMVAGVASGIAEHLGLPVLAVRVAFLLLLSANGLGALLYAAFWAVLPGAPGDPRRREFRMIIPFLALGVGMVLVSVLGGWAGINSALSWLVAIIAVGAGIIWHPAGEDGRRRWTARVPQARWFGPIVVENGRRTLLVRLVGGGGLVVVGVIGIIAVFAPLPGAGFTALANGLLYALIALAGVALVAAPLLWRTFSQLRAEREARIREQERAELAAMVHDQVLHTLALIMRNSGDPKTVQRLARGQERTLRNWLYKPTGRPSELLAAALEEIAAEVEDTYAIVVETVVVGDRSVDETVRALVAASREALVNAGRHAKVQSVSLYAEVEPEQCSVFVRDRGVGFDLAAVERTRHGVRGSIIGRMERHGGRAEIRSEPGEGTEVRLYLPLPDPATRARAAHARPGSERD